MPSQYVGLLHDEIKIKADLVYNKHSGELIGFMNLDDVGNAVLNMEQRLFGDAPSHVINNTFKPTVTSSISRASHIIGYNISAEIPPVAKCAIDAFLSSINFHNKSMTLPFTVLIIHLLLVKTDIYFLFLMFHI
jgi:hypothetical protein